VSILKNRVPQNVERAVIELADREACIWLVASQSETEYFPCCIQEKIYTSVEELQIDVDHWIAKYNETCPYSGKYCYAKTLMQIFRETKYLAIKKTDLFLKHLRAQTI
jgi:hypothetical protein